MSRGEDFNNNPVVNGFTFRQTKAGSDFYGKMFMMVVSLYTSRVILKALRVEDFGKHFCQP